MARALIWLGRNHLFLIVIGVLLGLVAIILVPIIPVRYFGLGTDTPNNQLASDGQTKSDNQPKPLPVGQRVIRNSKYYQVPEGAHGTIIGSFGNLNCTPGNYEIEWDYWPRKQKPGETAWCAPPESVAPLKE